MKDLKINPVLIIGYTEHIVVILIHLNKTTRKSVLLHYLRCFFAVLFKIIPKHARAESQIKAIHLRKNHVQCLLQNLRLNLLTQGNTNPIDIGHTLSRCNREDICRIVQLLPADIGFPARHCFCRFCLFLPAFPVCSFFFAHVLLQILL